MRLVEAHLEQPLMFDRPADDDPFARVPMARYSYRPDTAVVYYAVAGVERT